MSGALGSVLVTSAGAKVPLIRALRQAALRLDPYAKVVAGDVDEAVASRFVADDFWAMQGLGSLDLDAFIGECQRRDIRTLLPTRDGELVFWAGAAPRLDKAGIAVITSRLDSLNLCLDKLAFAEWGAAHGLPVIPAATTAAMEASALVVKERFGAGSRSIGIGLTGEQASRHAEDLDAPIFQPLIAGKEISIDAYLTKAGAVHGLVLRHRSRVLNGESQTTVTFRDAGLEAKARAVLEPLHLSGPVVMQAMVEGDQINIIEVNARFGGASTASINVGLDLFYWALFERAYPEAPLPAFERSPFEIRQVRVAEDLVLRDPDL
jgi:carbamoyl-phosphate synthase large subunit